MKKPFLLHVFRVGFGITSVMICLCMAVLIGFLLIKSWPALNMELFFGKVPPLDALLGKRAVWDGIWPACAGSLFLVVLTMALALLPGIGCGLYLAVYATPREKRILNSMVDMLAGTPSIVMGLFGFTLILFLRKTFVPNANTCLLLAAGCLALLVLPVLIVSTREAALCVPERLRITALALGMSKRSYLGHILLPSATRGIGSGVLLATGRATEDTAVIMLTGVVANSGLPSSLLGKFEALPFSVFYLAAQYQDQDELLRGFGAAVVLLFLAFFLLGVAREIEKRYRKHWAGVRI